MIDLAGPCARTCSQMYHCKVEVVCAAKKHVCMLWYSMRILIYPAEMSHLDNLTNFHINQVRVSNLYLFLMYSRLFSHACTWYMVLTEVLRIHKRPYMRIHPSDLSQVHLWAYTHVWLCVKSHEKMFSYTHTYILMCTCSSVMHAARSAGIMVPCIPGPHKKKPYQIKKRYIQKNP